MNFEFAISALLFLVIALLMALLRQGRRHVDVITELQKATHKSSARLFTQLEIDRSLRDRLDLHKGLPYSHNWSASPDFLKLIVDHALTAKPSTIVECSSGLTSLMLARCCEMNGQCHVFSLENGEDFAAKTQAELERYGIGRHASIIHAPLTTYPLDGREFQWYALDNFPVSNPIDMLVIDGPPGFLQRHSRHPALPLLFDRLADDCSIFMDDAARPDEREIVAMWQARFPNLEHEYVDTERGSSILRLKRR